MPAYGHHLLLRRGSDRRAKDDRALRLDPRAGGRHARAISVSCRKIERAGTVSLTELGRLAELDRSTIGRNVKALEKLRLVRTAPAEDQREAAVRLTPAGERRCESAAPLWEEAQRRVEAALGAGSASNCRRSRTVFDFFANTRVDTRNGV